MSTQKDTHSDAIALIAGIGQKARAASRAMARASTASKNEALIHLAGLVRKNAGLLKTVNAKEIEIDNGINDTGDEMASGADQKDAAADTVADMAQKQAQQGIQ